MSYTHSEPGSTIGYHEGYIAAVMSDGTLGSTDNDQADPDNTGRVRAICTCGWTADQDAECDLSDADGPYPSTDLEDQVMEAWQQHVRGLIRNDDHKRLAGLLRQLPQPTGPGLNLDRDELDGLEQDLTTALELTRRLRTTQETS